MKNSTIISSSQCVAYVSPSRRCGTAAELIDSDLLAKISSAWLPAETRTRSLLAKLSELLQLKLQRIIETFNPDAPPTEINSTAFIAIQSLLNETDQQGISTINGLLALAPFSTPGAPLPRTGNLTADFSMLVQQQFNRSSITDINSAFFYVSQVSSRLLNSAVQVWSRMFGQDRTLIGQLNDVLPPTFFQNVSVAIWNSQFDGINWEAQGMASDEASCFSRAVAVVSQILAAPLAISNTSISNGIPLTTTGIDYNLFQRCKLRRFGRNVFSSTSGFQQATIFTGPGAIVNASPLLESFGALQIADGARTSGSFFDVALSSIVTPRRPLSGTINVTLAAILVQQVTGVAPIPQRLGLPTRCVPGFASNYTLSTNLYGCYKCNASHWCPGSPVLAPSDPTEVAVEYLCSNGPQTSPPSVIYTNVGVSTANCPFLCIDQYKYYDATQNLCVFAPGGTTRRNLGVGSSPSELVDCPAPLPTQFYEWNQECSYNTINTAVLIHQNASIQKINSGLFVFLNFRSANISAGQTILSLPGVIELSMTKNSTGVIQWSIRLTEFRNGVALAFTYSSLDALDPGNVSRIILSLRKLDNSTMALLLGREDNGRQQILISTTVAPLFIPDDQKSTVVVGDELELKSVSFTIGNSELRDSQLILSLPESLWFDSSSEIAAPVQAKRDPVPFSLTSILSTPCVPSISVRFINITLSGANIASAYPRWIESPTLPTSLQPIRCKLQTPSGVWIDIPCPPWPSNLIVSGVGVSFEYPSAIDLASPLPFMLRLYSETGSSEVWSVSVKNFAGTTFLTGAVGPHAQNSSLQIALESTISGTFCRACPSRTIFSFESLGGCVCEAGYELQPQNDTCAPNVRQPDLPTPGSLPSVSVVGVNSTVYNDPLGTIEIVIPASVRTVGVPDDATLVILVLFDQGLPSSQFGIPASARFPVSIFVNRPFALLDRLQLHWFSESYSSSPRIEFLSIGEPVVLSSNPILTPPGGTFYEPINVFFSTTRNIVDPFFFSVSTNGGPAQISSNPVALGANTTLAVRIVGSKGEVSREVVGVYTFLERPIQEVAPDSSNLQQTVFVCNGGCIAGIVVALVVGFAGVSAFMVIYHQRTNKD